MEFHCPHCQSPIYSRKQKICGVCEKPLPPELLLSDEQIAVLKKQDAAMENQARKFNPETRHDSGGSGFGMV